MISTLSVWDLMTSEMKMQQMKVAYYIDIFVLMLVSYIS